LRLLLRGDAGQWCGAGERRQPVHPGRTFARSAFAARACFARSSGCTRFTFACGARLACCPRDAFAARTRFWRARSAGGAFARSTFATRAGCSWLAAATSRRALAGRTRFASGSSAALAASGGTSTTLGAISGTAFAALGLALFAGYTVFAA
jgi:hypothetical protein